ncbi:MAG: sigma-54-dependent Fis family transcriptional regulator [Myxococcales bacterium]|nr:sigma-54-dependent Fis family transcriptional regulator [Myxococcales bacterium]
MLVRWARALRAGAVPDGPSLPLGVTDHAVRESRARLEPLIDVGSPFEAFAEAVEEAGFAAFLADVDGVVVRRQGSGALDHTLLTTRLLEGACWGEPARGTNAIGTVAAERAPVAVVGAAHFERRNHALVCYAAPIHDVRGELVAVLDASGPVAAAGAFAHAAVIATAATLEATWIGRAYEGALPGGLFALERVLAALPHAAMVVERTGRVRLANAAARTLLTPADRRDARRFLVGAPSRDLRVEVEEIVDSQGAIASLVHLRPRAPKSTPLVEEHPAFAAIVGQDPAIVEARARAARFARTELPVVLLAETGCGKELFARAVHAASPRASGPFVAINCGSLSASLLESELFGYGPGAFTGARSSGSHGKLAAAHRGTLFLDEVAEMPAPLQALLLRFLEEGAYYRVGETSERHADVRIVAATCRDLPALVQSGAFRSDLYYRIRGATIRLPTLRERTDRLELAIALVARLSARAGRAPPTLGPSAQAFIGTHGWPGNVRELRSALEHALALVEGPTLERAHLPIDHEPQPTSLDHSEKTTLLSALDAGHGNLSETARLLGVARTTLYRMMQRHGLRS